MRELDVMNVYTIQFIELRDLVLMYFSTSWVSAYLPQDCAETVPDDVAIRLSVQLLRQWLPWAVSANCVAVLPHALHSAFQ